VEGDGDWSGMDTYRTVIALTAYEGSPVPGRGLYTRKVSHEVHGVSVREANYICKRPFMQCLLSRG
jgi:hypothetical protein